MRSLLFLLLLVCLGFAANSQGIKMKITGVTDTTGEEVLAFEMGDTTTFPTGGGSGGSGPVNAFEFVKIKMLKGPSGNELFKRSISGNHTADVTFSFYNSNAALFYTILIKDVTVNHFSYLSPECANCGKLFHEIWFDYRQVEVTDVNTGAVMRYNRNTKVFY